MMHFIRISVVLLLSLPSVCAPSAGRAAATSLSVVPPIIKMGAFYNGERLRIEGIGAAGAGVVVAIRGAGKDECFNMKGRVGPIWYNADRVHVFGVPSLLLSFGSDSIGALLSRESIDEYQLDEAAIMKGMHCRIQCECKSAGNAANCAGVEPDEANKELIRANLLRFKSGEGSYLTIDHAVDLDPSAGEHPAYSVELLWPKRAPAGTYTVEAYLCRDGSVIDRQLGTLQVVGFGVPARVASMARDYGIIYGVLAVIAAAIAGFGMDFLASRLRRRRDRGQTEEIQGH